MTENVEKTTLPNGVRVVTERVETVQSVAVGLWVATGSRDEDPKSRGISHFLEHMLFKGTARRPTPQHIADEMDAIGGYLNAFTDKEYTCYYARVLAEHLPVAIDLLGDMYVDSLFDPDETARERKVVLEEIKRRDDDPEDLVHDLFAETIHPGHPLGLPVIGTAKVVSGLTPEKLRAYMKRRYGAESVIVAASGNLDHAQTVAFVEAALGRLEAGEPRAALPPLSPNPGNNRYSRPDEQANFCVGVVGRGQFDDDRWALSLLDTILGGSMGARLFMEIREKRGLAYTVGSYSALYREGGYFAAYGGTSPENLDECISVVQAEFEKVRQNGVTAAELERAKNQFRGALIMGQESMSNRMNRLGKSEVYYDHIHPLAEVLARIESVTLGDVHAIAQAIFPDSVDGLTIAAVGPFDPEHQSEAAAPDDDDSDDGDEG